MNDKSDDRAASIVPPPSESVFRALIEHAHDVVATLDAQGTVLYVSPAVRHYGNDPALALGQNIAAFFHPDEVEGFRRVFSRVLAEPGASVCFEHRVLQPDGSFRHKDTVLQNLLHEPSVRAVVAVAHDVTERKRTEAELRQARDVLEQRVARDAEHAADLQEMNRQLWEQIQGRERAEEEIRRSEERFRNVVEDQTEFIVRWLPDGTRTFVNSSYCRYFGQSREELLGASFFPLIYSEDERERLRHMTAALTLDDPVAGYEQRVIRPDGSVGWTQWNDRAIFDAEGRLVEFQSVGRDITAQRAAEEKLQQQQDELAHVARLSVMGEMVAAIAHEVRQPLHAIDTFASVSERALEANRPDSARKALDCSGKVREQVTRIDEIIRRLRQFTKPSAAQRQPMDVNQAVLAAVELLAADLRRRRVRVRMQLDRGLPPLTADTIQIEQVLVNLVRNAAEAMSETPEDQRWVRIETSLGPEQELQVAVQDRGAGVSDEALQRLFHAFYTTKPEGTGIGLAVSRRIIDEHGGRLWAQRREEGGMTFALALPLGVEVAHLEQKQPKSPDFGYGRG
jgi:PAS domain S-box-containing protein